MMPWPRDTRDRAARVQLDAHRSMNGAERYRIASEMSDFARDVAITALRARNPGATESELIRVFLDQVLG